MANERVREVDARVSPPPPPPPGAEPSLGELFRQLTQDSTTLIRQEIALAKAELRENMGGVARSAAMIAVGGAVALVGLLVLTAFLVILLGDLIGNYWLAALIVGLLFAVIGGVLVSTHLKRLRETNLRPDQTIQTLQEDKQWLQSEIQDVKRELT
ncbi:MAG TPA: phage holin family protein [Longimicrobiaceae bacterium]|nr:phage holin family protein [Longimicrobiaceae bacterium]